ncbi:phage tail protein [Methylobacterium gnaphalii]|uniref:Tail protein n=1 Tax=Methylobacterium gnaphalii TaxID=1010610 RepID=A0A512JPP3_9HYPH|nr:phage tail protein [Methylobacterium gnaphalii]GEP11833.1 hypothetical protein MGN01_36780 [Methylobacterium gnaphalii]GJD69417.1 hypothetical protein MMMDOFMJ_2348 [Methylobacterium gnaphalii]GLS49627.1 hypothetical protein GCM10007885_24760 [Methylobacterium gnaphalii]
MLWQIGSLTLDTFTLPSDDVEEEVSADFAKHPLIATRKDYEFAGPGDDPLEISGKILPFHVGGLAEFELAKALCTSGEPQFVMRGDGQVFGWHQIMSVRGRHKSIGPSGVGFEVECTIRLERCGEAGSDAGAGLIDTIIGLFG